MSKIKKSKSNSQTFDDSEKPKKKSVQRKSPKKVSSEKPKKTTAPAFIGTWDDIPPDYEYLRDNEFIR